MLLQPTIVTNIVFVEQTVAKLLVLVLLVPERVFRLLIHLYFIEMLLEVIQDGLYVGLASVLISLNLLITLLIAAIDLLAQTTTNDRVLDTVEVTTLDVEQLRLVAEANVAKLR